jgi:hypothetical protein
MTGRDERIPAGLDLDLAPSARLTLHVAGPGNDA